MENTQQNKTRNFECYLLDLQYKDSSNLNSYIKEAQNFYNGEQYPNLNYKNMIRITMNICSFSSNLKAAKIVGTQQFIQYTSDSDEIDCTALRRFDEYNQSKLNDKTENFQTALDGFNNGIAIVYYRFDKDDTSYKGIFKGGLVLEQIDILKFAVANPYMRNLQNQKWVMFWKDEEVGAIRDLVERENEKELEEVKKLIVPDDLTDEDAENHQYINHGLCSLFTRFFKIDGEVYYMVSTKDVDVYEYPHALSPLRNKELNAKAKKIVDDYKKKMKEADGEIQNGENTKFNDYKMDYEDMIMQLQDTKPMSDGEYQEIKEKFSLYPFARWAPYEINNSFYGRSDIKALIPTQKGINFALSMMLKCIENNAYNKIFAKPEALQGQVITNEPGQVIYDYSKFTNQWGIKFAESQPMPNGVIEFIDRFVSMVRVFGGFNDVMDGSVSNQDISGYAIQQMIKQANSSIEQQQQLFWAFCKDKAAIRLLFYKFYVDKAKYTYELEDYQVESEEQSRAKLLKRQEQLKSQGQGLAIGEVDLQKPTKKTQVREIDGKDLYGSNFDINIDVMQGLADSKLAESQMWDTLLMNGGIQNMEPEMLEMYLEANPTVSAHTKQALKAIVEKQKRSENYQLKQQLAQSNQMGQKLAQYAKELEAQNDYKKSYIDNLTKEFSNKIGVANKVIAGQTKQMQASATPQTTSVTEGAAKSLNARGIAGADISTQ